MTSKTVNQESDQNQRTITDKNVLVHISECQKKLCKSWQWALTIGPYQITRNIVATFIKDDRSLHWNEVSFWITNFKHSWFPDFDIEQDRGHVCSAPSSCWNLSVGNICLQCVWPASQGVCVILKTVEKLGDRVASFWKHPALVQQLECLPWSLTLPSETGTQHLTNMNQWISNMAAWPGPCNKNTLTPLVRRIPCSQPIWSLSEDWVDQSQCSWLCTMCIHWLGRPSGRIQNLMANNLVLVSKVKIWSRMRSANICISNQCSHQQNMNL